MKKKGFLSVFGFLFPLASFTRCFDTVFLIEQNIEQKEEERKKS